MHGQAGRQSRQRQVLEQFQDAGYRVQVFVEDAVGAGALSVARIRFPKFRSG